MGTAFFAQDFHTMIRFRNLAHASSDLAWINMDIALLPMEAQVVFQLQPLVLRAAPVELPQAHHLKLIVDLV